MRLQLYNRILKEVHVLYTELSSLPFTKKKKKLQLLLKTVGIVRFTMENKLDLKIRFHSSKTASEAGTELGALVE